MKSLLEQTDKLDEMLRSINKMIAKLESTQIPAIFRELNRLRASLDKNKRDLIEEQTGAYPRYPKDENSTANVIRRGDSPIFSESDRGDSVDEIKDFDMIPPINDVKENPSDN